MKISEVLISSILGYAEKQEQRSKIWPYEKPNFKEYTSGQTQHHLKECEYKHRKSGGMKNEIGDYLAIGKLTTRGTGRSPARGAVQIFLNKGKTSRLKTPAVDCASACPAIVAKSSAKLIKDLRIIVTS